MNITDCMCCLLNLTQNAKKLGASFLNDEATMQEVMPSMTKASKKILEDRIRLPIGAMEKAQFRQWLCRYWRRDEEVLTMTAKTRLTRAAQTAAAIAGYGNPRNFGQEHPDFPLKKVKLFEPTPPIFSDDSIWEPYRRFLQVRLECFQFLGPAYYDVDFFTGLEALCLTYPLALAAARCHAAADDRTLLQAEDIMYAVAMLDHCHGRSPALQFPACRQVERTFAQMNRFQKLIFSLARPW